MAYLRELGFIANHSTPAEEVYNAGMTPNAPDGPDPAGDAIRDHSRIWRNFRYVYPVLSRRSRGLSVGVNLNPDKRCNFGCVYCQVDRTVPGGPPEIDLGVLEDELRAILAEAADGRIWREPKFRNTPPDRRRVNDIAFSGDGEPTCCPKLPEAVALAAAVRDERGLDDVKLVLITNASNLNTETFRRARAVLDENHGEIWAKLDAGTEEHFQRINRPTPPLTLETVVENLLGLAVARPVVIQTLLFALDGEPPPEAEIDAYARRIRGIVAAGGQIALIQLHTLARAAACPSARPLTAEQLDALAEQVRNRVGPVPVEVFHTPPPAGG